MVQNAGKAVAAGCLFGCGPVFVGGAVAGFIDLRIKDVTGTKLVSSQNNEAKGLPTFGMH